MEPRPRQVERHDVVSDLFDLPVEAIVNPWNTNRVPRWLLRPGGVSGQLRRRAGTTVFRELARTGPLALGQAVVTEGGNLDQTIIHVAVIGPLQRARPETVETCMTSAVRCALDRGITSIATPLLGAGHGHLKPAGAHLALHRALDGFDTGGRHLAVYIADPTATTRATTS